jgi:hypothetical protein
MEKEKLIELNNGVIEESKFWIKWYNTHLGSPDIRKDQIQVISRLLLNFNKVKDYAEKENKTLYNQLTK